MTTIKGIIKISKKTKVLLIFTEVVLGSVSTTTSSTIKIVNLFVSIIISSSTALLTSIAILITIEYILKLKVCYTKLRDWIISITFLYEKTLKQSMIDKRIDKKEALETEKS